MLEAFLLALLPLVVEAVPGIIHAHESGKSTLARRRLQSALTLQVARQVEIARRPATKAKT